MLPLKLFNMTICTCFNNFFPYEKRERLFILFSIFIFRVCVCVCEFIFGNCLRCFSCVWVWSLKLEMNIWEDKSLLKMPFKTREDLIKALMPVSVKSLKWVREYSTGRRFEHFCVYKKITKRNPAFRRLPKVSFLKN